MNDGRQDKLLSARTVGLRGAEARAGVLQGLLAVHPLATGVEVDAHRQHGVIDRILGIVERGRYIELDTTERIDHCAKSANVDDHPPVDWPPDQIRDRRCRQITTAGCGLPSRTETSVVA